MNGGSPSPSAVAQEYRDTNLDGLHDLLGQVVVLLGLCNPLY